jgi:hypothetical protein
MRKVIVFLCFALSLQAESASKGALIEALFIMQNKYSDTQSYVRELKKALTEACLVTSNQDPAVKKAPLVLHHSQLHCTLYPELIKELEELQGKVLKDIELLSAENPELTPTELNEKVDFAFLLKDKVSVVSRLLKLIFAVDRNEAELDQKRAELKGKQKRPESATAHKRMLALNKRIHMLQKSISYDKKRVRSLRSTLRKIDKELYPGKELADRLYLYKVNYCKGS